MRTESAGVAPASTIQLPNAMRRRLERRAQEHC
jgi:hypothetical protein